MSIREDIRILAARANRAFDEVHDFYVHSEFIWSSFVETVASGKVVQLRNKVTGNTVDQDDLVRLSAEYAAKYLITFTFRQFVSTFEVFLFDFLHRVLMHNPWQFGATQLTFEVVLKARDREEVISGVIARRLNELKYERLSDWFDTLKKALRLDLPGDDEIAVLTEIKAARDLLEHNAGVVNETYLRKVGKRARYELDEEVQLDDDYLHECWLLMKKVVDDVTGGTLTRMAAE